MRDLAQVRAPVEVRVCRAERYLKKETQHASILALNTLRIFLFVSYASSDGSGFIPTSECP